VYALSMAEVLGGLASAVQLVDVALRASCEAYSFLSAIKNAPEDVRLLRDGKEQTAQKWKTLTRA
jgi:hypothetical protein